MTFDHQWTRLPAPMFRQPVIETVADGQADTKHFYKSTKQEDRYRTAGSVVAPNTSKTRNPAIPRRRASTPTHPVQQEYGQACTPSGLAVDRWEILRTISKARKYLKLSSGAVKTLEALLSFHRRDQLIFGDPLIVFPSNAALSARTHGVAASTLRKHIAELVDAGMIQRKDSPNCKRYSRCGAGGAIVDAFGFDLSPLVMRAEEIAAFSRKIDDEKRAWKLAKDDLSVLLREVGLTIADGLAKYASDAWHDLLARFDARNARLRSPTLCQLKERLAEIQLLQDEAYNLLIIEHNSEQSGAIGIKIERHIQKTNIESLYEDRVPLEETPASEPMPMENQSTGSPVSVTWDQVARAFPEFALYGTNGRILSHREFQDTGHRVSVMLGISPAGYRKACQLMGRDNAAATIAYILEQGMHVKSAGGYLTELTKRFDRGEYSVARVVSAFLLRGHATAVDVTGSSGPSHRLFGDSETIPVAADRFHVRRSGCKFGDRAAAINETRG